MIRFCDCEVCCVSYDELDRNMLLNYFFQDHMDEMICVIDSKNKYKGKIVYYALINTDNVYDAVQEDGVVLDQDIWQNARNYFSYYKSSINEHVLLPVVDKEGQLICFAYEDQDANREIRMLRELSENIYALQFQDIYPEYQFVDIYECNELAYFFAKYLEGQNIAVQVHGELWHGLFEGTDYVGVNYKRMTIYAEGVNPKKADWLDNLLQSVSVEFECIDSIYEANIKSGIFRDAEGGLCELLNCLKDERQIIIIGSGCEAQDVYDFLMKNKIDVCCFVNENYGERSHRLFGKEILSCLDARNKYKNPIFIECISKHSAWGFGWVDYYDYLGYRRNKSYYLIKDYIDIEGNGLENALKDKKVVLLGNIYLCAYLFDIFMKKGILAAGYLDMEKQSDGWGSMPGIPFRKSDNNKNTVYLLVFPEYNILELKQKQYSKKSQLTDHLKKYGLDNYSDYFVYTSSFIGIEGNKTIKYTKESIIPKRIILGSIERNCGNSFFRQVLDGHPSILMLANCNLSDQLFRCCICLAMVKPDHVMSIFEKMCEEEDGLEGIYNRKAFNEKMEQLLNLGEKFTSQELFVMFHIAYMYSNGWNILEKDINNMIIYWEPHGIQRKEVEDLAKWLGNERAKCSIINIVRNIVMRNGDVKRIIMTYEDKRRAFDIALNCPSIEKRNYPWCDRLIVKFEDLKCEPRRELLKLCDYWEIDWSDSLMETSANGKKVTYNNGEYTVSGFDIKPVYNINEKYFSEFDRFRIMLINLPWQKKYGYPYVKVTQFTRRELQEMFSKRFRFEDMIDFCSRKLEREYKLGLAIFIKDNLQRARMIEIMCKGC